MNEISSIKKPPHNVELEQQILGAVLANNDRYHGLSFLRADHFYYPVHADIWRNISARIERDHIASPVTLKTDLADHAGLKELGGAGYLARMVGTSVSSFAVGDYARELVQIAGRRDMLAALRGTVERLEGGLATQDAQSEIEVFLHAQEAQSESPRSMSLLAAHIKSITELNERQMSGEVGLSTGLRDLDEITGGLHGSEVTLVAGSTSMGKSALGVHLAYVAAKSGVMVGIASLEMSEVALSQRMGSINSGIPYQALRNVMSDATFRKVAEATKAQEALPIQIYSDKVRDIPSILSESRRLQRQNLPSGQFKGFGLLVIDYIQLVRGKGQNSLERLGQVAMDCKQIAKLLGVPVVALAQVDRSLGKRDNPIPFLSDLRGSGDLEFAADNVIFCHRPEYYLEKTLQQGVKDIEERVDLEAALAKTKGKMDLIVAKQRMGKLGKCTVEVDMGTNVFRDMPEQQGDIEF
tara:strand:- start:11620 stop:13023 length:1404 start_codon:yes stop_codon:yes gene_type:complete